MSAPPLARTPQGVQVELGEEIARGGEGAVYEVRGAGDVLAKIYHEPQDAERVAKLTAMVPLASAELLAISAWPRELLHVGPGREVRGLIIPRLRDHQPIHALYGPAQRREEFPKADWRFLVHAARNLAAAFATFHQHGHVIADVNQGNVFVSHDGTVRLIDCDSMQIREGGRIHPCDVGVAHFTPPELQGRSFDGIVRDANHDAFGLAVLVFHLLFMGRHPYAGIYGGGGEMPLERAIAEGRFAYGGNASSLQMRPPPHTLSLAHLTPEVAGLFERAFAPGSPRRPAASEWHGALERMGAALQPCPRTPAHWHLPSSGDCPWCAIEQGGGPDFFSSLPLEPVAAGGMDLDALWGAIQALPPVLAQPGMNLIRPTSAAAGTAVRPAVAWTYLGGTLSAWIGAFLLGFGILFGAGAAGAAGALLLLVGWAVVFASGGGAEKKERQAHLQTSRQRHQAALERYAREVHGPLAELALVRREIETRRAAWRDLPSQYRSARAALPQQLRENQLHRFLDRFHLSTAGLPDVTPAMVSALASFGIETAADVTYEAVIQVPGYGLTLTDQLLGWRADIEARFVFDPAAGVDPADVAALDRGFAQARRDLEREMEALALRLRRGSDAAAAAHAELYPLLESAAAQLARAQADAMVF